MRVFAREKEAWYLENHGMTSAQYRAQQAANRTSQVGGHDEAQFADFLAGLGLGNTSPDNDPHDV